MEKITGKLFAFLGKNALIFFAGIGMGIYRCALEWPVWYNNSFAKIIVHPFALTDDLFLFIDAGKVVGLVVYLVVCYLFDKRRKSNFLFVLPTVVLATGYLCPLLTSGDFAFSDTVIIISLMLVGAGIGMLFAQWIEFCGFLPPVKVIQVLALSYIVRFFVFPVLTGSELFSSAVLIIVLAGLSFLLLSFGFSKVTVAESWVRKTPNKQNLFDYGSLFLWVCVFAFAYGFGESSTHLAHSPFEAGLGKVLPSLFILILAFNLGDKFDRNILYAIALPLMTVGLISIEFLDAAPSISQVFISAAFSSFHLLAYTIACTFAYQSRTSAMFAGVGIRVLALIAADVAVLLVRFNPAWDNALIATIIILVTLVVGILMFLPQVSQKREHYQFESGVEVSEQRRLETIAYKAGLSQREVTVFQLLVMGKSTHEISEELFISNGAVRAHCSRIYDKFGVHSRRELNALFLSTSTKPQT